MNVFSYPQRLNPDGSFATVDQLSAAGKAEAIAAFIFTHRGERPLALGFGSQDPTFGWFEPGEVSSGVSVYNPEISIDDVSPSVQDGSTSQILVSFE